MMNIVFAYSRNKFWHDIAQEQWDEYFIFPMSKYFSEPCRYTDIFSDKWGAAYYSHLWAEMLAADIHLTFAEEKDDASVGARFVLKYYRREDKFIVTSISVLSIGLEIHF